MIVTETEINKIVRYAYDHIQIFRIRVESLPGHRTNVYLILDGGKLTLVDVGFHSDKTFQDLEQGFDVINSDFKEDISIKDVSDIFITHGHGDHFGMLANNRFKGKRVYMHSLDSNHIKNYPSEFYKWKDVSAAIAKESGCSISPEAGDIWTPDKLPIRAENYELIEVNDERDIINGYSVYHTPGHSPGHICLKVGPVLFLGDHILSLTTPHQSPKTSYQGGGLEIYLASLRKASQIETEVGLPGHEQTIFNVKDRAREIEEFHHQRLEEIIELCSREKNLYELTRDYYLQHPEFIQTSSIDKLVDEEKVTALQEIKAHVEYLLEHDEMIISSIDNDVIKYCSN